MKWNLWIKRNYTLVEKYIRNNENNFAINAIYSDQILKLLLLLFGFNLSIGVTSFWTARWRQVFQLVWDLKFKMCSSKTFIVVVRKLSTAFCNFFVVFFMTENKKGKSRYIYLTMDRFFCNESNIFILDNINGSINNYEKCCEQTEQSSEQNPNYLNWSWFSFVQFIVNNKYLFLKFICIYAFSSNVINKYYRRWNVLIRFNQIIKS